MPMSLPKTLPKNVAEIPYEPKKSSIPRMRGGTCPVIYAETNFKDKYVDEYTGEILPPHLIRDAIIDELDYFNSKVWQPATTEEMKQIQTTSS